MTTWSFYCVTAFEPDGDIVDYSEYETREEAENELRNVQNRGFIATIEEVLIFHCRQCGAAHDTYAGAQRCQASCAVA